MKNTDRRRTVTSETPRVYTRSKHGNDL